MRALKHRFFLRLVLRSLGRRWRKGMMALLAVAAATTVAASTLGLALGIEGRVAGTLTAYGPNIVLVDRAQNSSDTGSYIPEEYLDRLVRGPLAQSMESVIPYLYGVAKAGDRSLVVAGTDFVSLRDLSRWWEVEGAWAADGEAADAMVGANAARKLGLRAGDQLTLVHEGHEASLLVEGLVTTGSDEENQVFVTRATAQQLLDRRGYVSLIEARAKTPSEIEATARETEELLPAVRAVTIRQVAEAERHLVGRVVLLLTLVTVGVVVASAVGVAVIAMTAVLERRSEIGLMKALGARDADIWRLFLAEAVALGLVGGLLGSVAGFGLAQVVGWTVFSTGVPWSWEATLAALALAVVVVVAAAMPPVRTAAAVDPVVVLRSD